MWKAKSNTKFVYHRRRNPQNNSLLHWNDVIAKRFSVKIKIQPSTTKLAVYCYKMDIKIYACKVFTEQSQDMRLMNNKISRWTVFILRYISLTEIALSLSLSLSYHTLSIISLSLISLSIISLAFISLSLSYHNFSINFARHKFQWNFCPGPEALAGKHQPTGQRQFLH